MNASPRFSGSVLVWLGLGFVVFLLSVAIPIVGPLAGGAGVGLALLLAFFLLLQFRVESNRDWFFWFMLILPLALGIPRKINGMSLFGIWQLGLLALATFGLGKFWQDIRRHALLRGAMVAFLAFLIIGSISTVTGRSHKLAATYQIFSDLKPILALALGYAFAWNTRVEKTLWFLVKWTWLPCLLLVAFEWLSPNLYFKVFGAGAVGGISEDPAGLFPSRAVGLFEHSSFLAAMGAVFGLLALARSILSDNEHHSCWFAVVMNFSLIICAVQRQEMVAFIGAGAMIFALSQPSKVMSRITIGLVGAIFAIVTFATVFERNLEKEAAQWGYGTVGALEQPRAQIFSGAFLAAKIYYPVGAGFGTFGGAGAEKFDQSLYDRLGFTNYYWYGKKNYLMDTYWPNSIAETGVYGASALMLSYLLLLLYAIKRSVKEPRPAVRVYWLATMAMMAYMMMLSFSSPAFQDLRLFILPAMMYGIASTVSKDKKS